MKKHFFLLIMALSLSVFVGCDYDDEYTPPNYVTFEKPTYGLIVNEGQSSTMNVTVYTANITNSDRTFDISILPSTTLSAAAYTIPTSVTIPAGTNEATFTVEVSDTNLNNAGDKLIFKLGEERGLSTGPVLSANAGRFSTVNITRVCPFEIAGEYMITEGAATTSRPVTIVAGTAANQYIAKDLYGVGFDITFTVNPTTGVITVPRQPGFVHPDFGAGTVISMTGSRVEACDKRLRILIQRSVSAGNFATRTDILRKVVQ